MSDDTDKHERIEAPGALHTEVVKWCADILASARHSKQPPEVIRDFEKLLAMARGER